MSLLLLPQGTLLLRLYLHLPQEKVRRRVWVLKVVGAPIHLEWTQMVQFPQDSEQTPRVMCFIHSRLSRLRFALRRDIVDHRDIQLLSFFNRGRCQFLMNVYSDDLYTAVEFLSRKALNIPNLLYMGGDFNIS